MEALTFDRLYQDALTPKKRPSSEPVELTDAEIEARIAAARAEGGTAWPADRPREGKRTEPRGRPPGARRGGRR